MRDILCHESKVIERMLKGMTECKYPLPETVSKVLTGPDSAARRPIVLNETFTIYFCEETTDGNLKLVNCELGIPQTIGNELLLVEEKNTRQLAFLEFMGPVLPDDEVLLPYVCSVVDSQFVRSIAGEFTTIVDDFGEFFERRATFRSHCCQMLTHARFLVLDSVVCFYLGTSDALLANQPETSVLQNCVDGTVQLHFLEDDIALEGWLHCYPEEANESEKASG